MSDCLQLIHFHIGSQVTNIRRIKTALKEASQFYVQLQQLGYDINFVDIGGGLGVDYDGTRSSTSGNSMNYSIQEYVNDAISSLVDACEKMISASRISSQSPDVPSRPTILCWF